jgi:hypothetical protein
MVPRGGRPRVCSWTVAPTVVHGHTTMKRPGRASAVRQRWTKLPAAPRGQRSAHLLLAGWGWVYVTPAPRSGYHPQARHEGRVAGRGAGEWRSLAARRLWVPKARGSNPLSPTRDDMCRCGRRDRGARASARHAGRTLPRASGSRQPAFESYPRRTYEVPVTRGRCEGKPHNSRRSQTVADRRPRNLAEPHCRGDPRS